ncbi:hypothetical protein BX666DRAFT_1434574 [Dichotomocladium elegans]|nr:hypothetical protein BX666DRAFT_1434574 [Dichotomocladium elegans]
MQIKDLAPPFSAICITVVLSLRICSQPCCLTCSAYVCAMLFIGPPVPLIVFFWFGTDLGHVHFQKWGKSYSGRPRELLVLVNEALQMSASIHKRALDHGRLAAKYLHLDSFTADSERVLSSSNARRWCYQRG